jgi:hypothetical protein
MSRNDYTVTENQRVRDVLSRDADHVHTMSAMAAAIFHASAQVQSGEKQYHVSRLARDLREALALLEADLESQTAALLDEIITAKSEVAATREP